MSRIAQKLCDEIVNPAWTSYTDNTDNSVTVASKHAYELPSKPNANAGLRPVIVERKRVLNKVVLPNPSKPPKSDSPSKHSRKDFHCRETVLKRIVLVDRGLNTLISGPLRCDNNCVTNVRKRDKGSCKCTHKSPLIRKSSKEIQTMDSKWFSALSHKACTNCVEMVSNSTQYQSSLSNNAIRLRKPEMLCDRPVLSLNEQLMNPGMSKNSHKKVEPISNVIGKPNYLNNFKGARRWALSQCAMLGPDF